jgi:hypothetical protein
MSSYWIYLPYRLVLPNKPVYDHVLLTSTSQILISTPARLVSPDYSDHFLVQIIGADDLNVRVPRRNQLRERHFKIF